MCAQHLPPHNRKKKRNKKIFRTRTMPRMVIASEKRGRHTKSRVSTEEGYMLQQCLFPMAERKVAEKLFIHCYCVWFSLLLFFLLFHSFLFFLFCFAFAWNIASCMNLFMAEGDSLSHDAWVSCVQFATSTRQWLCYHNIFSSGCPWC